jgi:hypothetical protein
LYRTLLDDSVHAVCYISPSTAEPVEGVIVEPIAEFAQLQLGFVDQTQWRYEVIRPLVLQTTSKFSFRWWGVHSTLSGKHQLHRPSGPHSTEEEALDV